MKASFILNFICLYLLLHNVDAHSWVQCADYTDANASNWNVNNCRAYPRAYVTAFQYVNYEFGGNAGYDYRPTESKPCRDAPSKDAYTAKFPMANYTLGQRVCLTWPAKGHVAANCTSQWIVDHGVKVYRSDVNPSSDPSLSGFKRNLLVDLGAATGMDQKGFQHCPAFCQNMDKAFCEQCFTIPTNLAVGKYTLFWIWAFNTDTDTYSTCWDVNISK